MTDHDPATAPAGDNASLMAALRELDLPDRFLKDLAADPDHVGELLMEFVADLNRAGRYDQVRRLLETMRDHSPTQEDHQYVSIELAKLLRESQDTGDTAEAERITAELLRPGHLSEGPARLLGEDLQELERWDEALRCYNVAARQLLVEPPEELADEDDLSLTPLAGRLLARMKLGLALDAHDDVALAVAERQVMGAAGLPDGEGGAWPEAGQLDGAWPPEGPWPDDDGPEQSGPAQEVEALYSREAFDEARTRGLLPGESGEHNTDAYYRAAERSLRERARERPETQRSVVLHSVEEAVESIERSGLDPADSDIALAWTGPEITADDPRLQSWPPGRNEACWCGSGRKYKKCCGAPSNR